jgi:hypothetical protein
MSRLIPDLVRVSGNWPCFVWQSRLEADQWHSLLPQGLRIVDTCNDQRR